MSVFLFVLGAVAGACFMFVLAARDRAALVASHERDVERADAHFARELAIIREGFEMEKKLVIAATEQMEQNHHREIERLVASYDRLLDTTAKSVERGLRLAVTGSPDPAAPAITETRVADADEVAQGRVREATIERGMDHLRESYRNLGVQMNDAELREEVETLLVLGVETRYPDLPLGGSATVPAEASA